MRRVIKLLAGMSNETAHHEGRNENSIADSADAGDHAAPVFLALRLNAAALPAARGISYGSCLLLMLARRSSGASVIPAPALQLAFIRRALRARTGATFNGGEPF